MVTVARELTRFRLPLRASARIAPADSLVTRLGLAERIAELPDIITLDCGTDTLPREVEVYVQHDAGRPQRKRRPPSMFCRITQAGLLLSGLDDWQRNEVLLRRWGRLTREGVFVYMPRDESELNICWTILEQALAQLRARALMSGGASGRSRELPSFSRTNLQ
jgi:hypothetical protein